MKIIKYLVITILFSTALIYAQEMPQEEIEQEVIPVAYLDMNRVFEAHPRTIDAKKEFKKQLDLIQQNIEEIREQIVFLKKEIVSLKKQENILKPYYKQSISENYFIETVIQIPRKSEVYEIINDLTFSGAQMSLAPLDVNKLQTNIQAKISNKYKNLLQQDRMILDIKRQASKDMLAKQQKEVNEILADIYKKTKRYAENANIQTIVNKKSLLFGQDEMPDITIEFIQILEIEHEKGSFKLKLRSRQEAQEELKEGV
ncbi:MAG: hypothetical protein HOG70_02935 [Elusimicrobiaceae bacterium]|nr:hypothetical protein [Elusimicrobiaceae bacterium]